MKKTSLFISLLTALALTFPASITLAAAPSEPNTPAPSIAEEVYSAEATLDQYWVTNGAMARYIVSGETPAGNYIKVGIVPTGYTKPVKQDDGTIKYMPIYTYTADGYNFYKTYNEAISPSWWQRLWAARKPTTDKQISNIAKDIYSGKYNYGDKSRTDANTWIERGSFETLLREYIKRRDEGKTPEQILAENSEFLDLVSIKSQNPYADLIKDKNLFEAGYQSYSGFSAFTASAAKPAAITTTPVAPPPPAANTNILSATPSINLAKTTITINGAPLPYSGIIFNKFTVDPTTGNVSASASGKWADYPEYSLALTGKLSKNADGWWYINATYTGNSLSAPVYAAPGTVKYTFKGTLNLKGTSLQDAASSWTDDGKSSSQITILSTEAVKMPASWQLLKGTYTTAANLNITGNLRSKLK